jgi:hypothetical protein
LKNVTLQLPAGYELAAGIRGQDMSLYYELVKVSIMSDTHSAKLIMTVPLKTGISILPYIK